ncbi:MAG: cobalamin biosynthesis protein, partial [Nitrospirae bacterium]|nr:cobalamin biosynthesis protein [Nitrospirota bacterium]
MNPWQLGTAFALDLVFGDPKWLPHPVRVIGRTVTVFEKVLRQWVVPWIGERWSGVVLTFVVVGASYGISRLLIA